MIKEAQDHKLQVAAVSNDFPTTNGPILPAALFEQKTCVIKTKTTKFKKVIYIQDAEIY